jgi:tetratricopeptide (TPR) repeat protein
MNIDKEIQSVIEHCQTGNLEQAEYICKKVLEEHPDNVDALHFLGIICYQRGHHDRAIRNIKKALEIDPEFADAYNNLGNIFQEKKQLDEAICCYEAALRIDPNQAKTHYNLGIALQDEGRIDEAIDCYRKALELDLRKPGIYNNLGLALKDKGRVDEAIICYQRALEIDPDFAEAFYNLGSALNEQYHLDEAVACFQKAIRLNPNYAEAYNNMGNIFVIQGKLTEGIHCFRKALELKPTYAKALFNLVGNRELNYDDSEELFKVAKELIKRRMPEEDLIHAYFAMGKLCGNLHMFKESFEYYRLGNALKRAHIEFNIESHVEYLSRIKQTLSADFIAHRKSWGSNSRMPIFIFGMPRSGTSLVEQILASHPDIYGGGELQFFNQINQKLTSIFKINKPYPECLNFIDDVIAHEIAELYLRETGELAAASGKYSRITDKNPFNFYHIGLTALLFPEASFVHCRRHPLDTCISIYFHNFLYGNYFAYDLSELGRYYLEYLKLMEHWRKVLPIRIFELRYEEIVQQQEKVSRKLLEFCGVTWDPACLSFYKKDRPVYTASNWQVRQPIYTTSCGRWQNYEQFLDPLKKLLADFI